MARVKRGEVWLVRLDPTEGSEIRKKRPAVIVQNDIGNEHSDLTIVVPLSSQHVDHIYPFEALLTPANAGIEKPSRALCNQIRAVDTSRCAKQVGTLNAQALAEVESALKRALGIQ
jgi:mRNA interferase MazF